MEFTLPTGDTQNILCLVSDVEFVPVHNLVGVSPFCRNTTCGLSLPVAG